MTLNNRRSFTIMIIPHSEESTYSARLPLFAVKFAVAFLVIVVAGFCLLLFSYFRALADAREVYALREMNRAQQEEINALAAETQRMMEQVKTIDELVVFVTEKLDLDLEEMLNEVNSDSEEGFGYYQGGTKATEYHTGSLHRSGPETNGVLGRAAQNIIILQSLVPESSKALDLVNEYVVQADSKPSIWPTRGRIASGFGMRRIPYASGYQFHNGVDIVGAYGSAVWASADGEVIFTGYRGSYGYTVIIDHSYGFETLYAHLSGFAVNSGDLVDRGQTVGYMGHSGRSTGTHLHYEVHYNGSPFNPVNYMQ